MLIAHLKFRAYPYHLSLQVCNDLACSLACLPMYVLWAKNDFHNYFDKVENLSDVAAKNKRAEMGVGEVKLMCAEDFGSKGSAQSSRGEVEQILSDIELKRA